MLFRSTVVERVEGAVDVYACFVMVQKLQVEQLIEERGLPGPMRENACLDWVAEENAV